jgi:hypothetical protein
MSRHDNYPARDFQSHRPADRRGDAVDGPSTARPSHGRTRVTTHANAQTSADGQDATDQTAPPLPLPSSAPARENTRPPRPTTGTPHGVPNPRQSWEELTRNRSPLDGPQPVNAPIDRTALFDRLHSCPLPGACRIPTPAGSRPPGCCGCNPKSKPRLWEDAAHAPVEVHRDR